MIQVEKQTVNTLDLSYKNDILYSSSCTIQGKCYTVYPVQYCGLNWVQRACCG